MVHPDPDVLAGLALGDPGGDGTTGRAEGAEGVEGPEGVGVDVVAEQHVSSCPACSAAVGELRRVRDLARGLDAGGAVEWRQPPPGLWSRIEGELDGADDGREDDGTGARPTSARPATTSPAPPGPASVSFSPPSSRPSRSSTRRAPRGGRSTGVAWLAAAAVAGVLVGGVGASAFWRAPTEGTGTTTVASVALDTLDTRQPLGTAVLQRHDGTLDLRVEMGSLGAGAGYLEVWLLNADGKRMVSLGVMSQASTTFPVSSTLLEKGYVIVDVSREGFDDRPQHSGDSVVRGRLAV